MKNIPFHKTYLPRTTLCSIKDVLDSGWLTSGPRVKTFEQEFGNHLGTRHNIATSSCTAALHLAYLSHDVGPGDEIIVPSFTFCSTINTIVHTGATPIFCDIDEKTLCIDYKCVKKLITKKTKGVVVVHFAGMPADMDGINQLAKKHGLFIIEDAAHAFGAKYKGSFIGTGDNTTCFSFYATKNLTTIEGGMLTTSNDKIANSSRVMSFHGISKDAWKRYSKEGSWKYDVVSPGYKYNLTDIQAAIGLEQLQHIKAITRKRNQIVGWYRKYLGINRNLILPSDPPYENSTHAWHLFTIRLSSNSSISRDQLIEELKNKKIGTSVHFIPNHLQTYYKNKYGKISLPVTESIYTSILSLPLFIELTESKVRYVSNTINDITYK